MLPRCTMLLCHDQDHAPTNAADSDFLSLLLLLCSCIYSLLRAQCFDFFVRFPLSECDGFYFYFNFLFICIWLQVQVPGNNNSERSVLTTNATFPSTRILRKVFAMFVNQPSMRCMCPVTCWDSPSNCCGSPLTCCLRCDYWVAGYCVTASWRRVASKFGARGLLTLWICAPCHCRVALECLFWQWNSSRRMLALT